MKRVLDDLQYVTCLVEDGRITRVSYLPWTTNKWTA
jgi:hypothetical protein